MRTLRIVLEDVSDGRVFAVERSVPLDPLKSFYLQAGQFFVKVFADLERQLAAAIQKER